jgi:DNA-binding transcriptional ArsR family regulator
MRGVPARSSTPRTDDRATSASSSATAVDRSTRRSSHPRREATAPAATDAVLRALADPHRRQILRLVQHAELPAGRIAASFTLSQQAVSQHIGVLKQAGLLIERREGTRRLYALRHESLEVVRELLSEFWPDALGQLKRSVEAAHPRPSKRNP